MATIKLGYAPTRRSIFSAPDAIKYRGLTADRLKELGIDFVDIDDINEEGLLYDDNDVKKIAAKFKEAGVDGLFLPHCNFGTEYVCARLAKELNVPVLLWGPLDERPDENGVRLRDTQCGLFATGKVLRRFQIPFTYMTNCRLNDPVFERGLRDFLAVCNVVKTFRNIRILQISAKHLRDMGKAIEKRRAVQIESRCRSGDGKVVVEVDAQRLQIRDLRSFVMRFELFQPVRIIDPRGSP